MKTKVIMSANNKFDLKRMLNKYYYSENYYIDDNLEIKNNIKAYNGFLKVRVKKGRYQIYEEVKENENNIYLEL